jgi:hypothetical protein
VLDSKDELAKLWEPVVGAGIASPITPVLCQTMGSRPSKVGRCWTRPTLVSRISLPDGAGQMEAMTQVVAPVCFDEIRF